MDWLFLVLGLVLLVFAGDFLVKGSVGLALRFKISTLVIGMTVVSFGTSAPELLVSVNAALDGHPEISIGNVVGSNIANIALVLAITAIIFPIIVDKNTKKLDWPFMMLATCLFFLFSLDHLVSRVEGAILFTLLIAYTVFLIVNSKKQNKKQELDVEFDDAEGKSGLTKALLFLGGGIVGLYFGSDWLLKGAVGIAKSLGMEERVIAVTVVAFGTSVPELAASSMAAIRKETDISIGNLVGSNVFNIMAVIGISSMIHPIAVSENSLQFDYPWMLSITFLLLPLMLIGKKLGRVQGIILLALYITYTVMVLTNY